MKRIMQRLGTVVFWLGWPVWFFYFRRSSLRSRVLVVADNRLLLIKNWVGDGGWGLPGGGAKAHEPVEISAVRELKEEVGISVEPAKLQPLGDYTHRSKGLRFRAVFFLLRLDEPTELKLQVHEISEIGWFDGRSLEGLRFNDDARYAVDKFAGEILL